MLLFFNAFVCPERLFWCPVDLWPNTWKTQGPGNHLSTNSNQSHWNRWVLCSTNTAKTKKKKKKRVLHQQCGLSFLPGTQLTSQRQVKRLVDGKPRSQEQNKGDWWRLIFQWLDLFFVNYCKVWPFHTFPYLGSNFEVIGQATSSHLLVTGWIVMIRTLSKIHIQPTWISFTSKAKNGHPNIGSFHWRPKSYHLPVQNWKQNGGCRPKKLHRIVLEGHGFRPQAGP